MPSTKSAAKSQKRGKKSASFRIGRVRAYLRGRVWYLCYREHGHRRQPRVGPDKEAARQMAAEINAQLEVGIPSALGFEPISIPGVRSRWLDNHEYVRRSSVNTIRRYSSATQHLVNFIERVRPLLWPLRYLRSLPGADRRPDPDGHHGGRLRRRLRRVNR